MPPPPVIGAWMKGGGGGSLGIKEDGGIPNSSPRGLSPVGL